VAQILLATYKLNFAEEKSFQLTTTCRKRQGIQWILINAIYNVLVSTLHPDSIAYMNELNRDLYKNGNGKKQFLFDAHTDTTERLDSLLGRYKHQHIESEMTLPDLNSLSADFQKLIEYVEAKF